jgi:5-deoxy-glucuronate isomerase
MSASRNLVLKSAAGSSGALLDVRAADVGFIDLSFRVERLAPGGTYAHDTGRLECCIVVLGGTCDIDGNNGTWHQVGRRANVFAGLPYALYLPPGSSVIVTARTGCELAVCSCPAQPGHAPRLITPEECEVEVRGGGNATRQITHVMKPDFPADRLLVVEVYTPSGNWSSYPPHKHDVHNPPAEVALEETYYYRIDKPEGYAIQRLYTTDRRLDETLTVRDGDLVLIPEGYHPVVAAHGYTVYYLNALAGSARSMAASDDPEYAWIRNSWTTQDPRVPVVK